MNFTKIECREIKRLSSEYKEYHSTKLFSNEDINYFYRCITREGKSQWIFDRIHHFLSSSYPDNKAHLMPEIYIHRYPSGCEFSRHRDDKNYPDQVLNVGCLLDSNFSGGDFVLHKPFLILPKEEGILYKLEASREHEVHKITEGERWSLILFFTMKDLTETTLV